MARVVLASVLLLQTVAVAAPNPASHAPAANAAPAAKTASAPRTAGPRAVILVLGDSISAGYGLDAGVGWVDLLAARLRHDGFPQKVVNASISGDTTAGGRARLPSLLREYRPAVVIVELGGNDGLRGSDLAATRANLGAIVRDASASSARVLLLGIRIPPNYGPRYVREFDAMFGAVAKANGVALVPWLFAGFGEDLAMFQPDHIHPNASAQARILANVWPALLPLISTHGRAAPAQSLR